MTDLLLLALFVARIFADYPDHALAPDEFAVFTYSSD
jgi:hypothetical protein